LFTWLVSCLIVAQIVFEQSAVLEAEASDLLAIEYNRIHALAKDAIHLVEGLDAVLRSLECAIRAHAEMDKRDVAMWQATQDALHHRKEMFHSTKLRLSSIDQRLKNVINLVRHPFTPPLVKFLTTAQAFNIGSMRDSKVMREDSYIMKTLAVVAMIFLPISTVSSIFGTQFFNTVTAADPSPDGPIKSSTYISSQFWIFWTVAIPMTLMILSGWSLWIRRFQPKAQRVRRWVADVEKGIQMWKI